MKIIHFITRLILGGAQENTILTVRGQQEAGHDVTLAFGPIYGPEGSLLKQARETGARCVELSAMRRAVNPWHDLRGYRQCLKLIDKIKPHVVHTHSSKAGILGRAAAWKRKVPVVVHTIHGLPFHPFLPAWKNRVYIALERWAARRCHHIVTVADSMIEQAVDAGVGRADQYTTVYSGMELEPYIEAPQDREITRAELGFDDDDLVVGTVARLSDLKGHEDVMAGMVELVKQHPGLKLLWVGDGWLRPRHEKQLGEMGMADRVVMTGLIPPQDVPKMIRAMDLMVHPSYHEGLPRTVPQALLTATPVVAYDCDGSPEVCIPNETGYLVPTGDRDKLRQAIDQALGDLSRARAMATEGQYRCIERFDWRKMVSRIDRVYRQYIGREA